MSFWSSEKFIREIVKQNIVTPYDKSHIKHGAYELAVGSEAYITSHDAKEVMKPDEQLVIPSGQFAMLLTDEEVFIPLEAIGFISIRAGIKFRGLVNVSGFHVDPGYRGKLKFSVYNAGSQNIVLAKGDRIFTLWLCSLDRATKDGYANKAGQNTITSQNVMDIQGELASPANLKRNLDELKTELEKLRTNMEEKYSIVKGLLAALIAGIVMLGITVVKDSLASSKDKQTTKTGVNARDLKSAPKEKTSIDNNK